MPDVDIVVAGGGPAGLQFARSVAGGSAYSVTVLEANESLADNDKSTGGTFPELLERFDVPETVAMDTTDAVVFETADASGRLAVPGYVLDFPDLLTYLGEDAAANGATVHTGARVQKPLTEGGRVVGVEYRVDGATERLRADVVVDATGPHAVLASDLGLFDPASATRAVGKEYEFEGRHAVEEMLFRFDHDLAPGGYAWSFPAGDGVLKAGVCWLDNHYERQARDDHRIDEYIDAWLDDDRWTVERVRAVHAGKAYVDTSLSQRATDGFVAVGDTAASINPLLGEGIRPGMQSAEMAADVVVDALDAGDTSREMLGRYERRWNDDRGRHWYRQHLVSQLLYGFDADQQRRFVEKADQLTPTQLDRFERYELTLRDYLSVYPFSLRDLWRLPELVGYL